MTERRSDRWLSIALSVLLHATLVAALVYGWWTYRHRPQPPAPTLAIEASVVDARELKGASSPQQAPAPPQPQPPPPEPQPQPPVEPEGPPQPTPEELAQRAQQQKEQEEQAAEAKRQAEATAQALAQEKAEAQQKAEAQKAETARKEKEEADRKAKAEAEQKAKAQAEAKKRAQEQRLAEQKKQEEERSKADEAQREADLKRSLAAEDRLNAARSSGALASWQAQITARIQRAWLRPPSARAGIECVLEVTQVPGGEVTNVHLGACNGDEAVRDSIVAAVYRASPLPPPPDPALFERNLEITFKPSD